ncbi:MAG: 50S ribosomal protein L21 [Betaproteobacteria bacterium]|nr:50S ribosomal protein L21 [Betaproteobacteria bacterium]
MKRIIFQADGRQFRASVGETVTVGRVAGEVGAELSFAQVLAVEEGEAIKLGKPYLDGAVVRAQVIEHLRGPKLRIFKLRRRKNSRRLNGFRSDLSKLKITALEGV